MASVFDNSEFKDIEYELYKPGEKIRVTKKGREKIKGYDIYKITKYKNNDISSKNLTFYYFDII